MTLSNCGVKQDQQEQAKFACFALPLRNLSVLWGSGGFFGRCPLGPKPLRKKFAKKRTQRNPYVPLTGFVLTAAVFITKGPPILSIDVVGEDRRRRD